MSSATPTSDDAPPPPLVLRRRGKGPPREIRPVLRRLGFDYEKELRKLDDPTIDLVTVAITPL